MKYSNISVLPLLQKKKKRKNGVIQGFEKREGGKRGHRKVARRETNAKGTRGCPSRNREDTKERKGRRHCASAL